MEEFETGCKGKLQEGGLASTGVDGSKGDYRGGFPGRGFLPNPPHPKRGMTVVGVPGVVEPKM
jgi:hypothetical protein